MKKIEASCDEAMRVRKQYLGLSKKFAHDSEQYELYINVRVLYLMTGKESRRGGHELLPETEGL